MFLSAFILFVLHTLFINSFYNFFYNNCKEKKDEEIRASKTVKAVDNMFKGIYYLIVFIWGHIILRKEYFIPSMMLGSGDLWQLESKFAFYEGP